MPVEDGKEPSSVDYRMGLACRWKATRMERSREDTVAAFLPRAFISAAAAGVRVLCWFSSRDSVDGPMGVTSNEGKHRKAFGAFRTMTEQIGDYVLDRQLVGQDNPTSGIQAYLFRGPKGNKLVVWSVDDKIPVILGGSEGSAIRANDVQGKAIAGECRCGWAGATRRRSRTYLCIRHRWGGLG